MSCACYGHVIFVSLFFLIIPFVDSFSVVIIVFLCCYILNCFCSFYFIVFLLFLFCFVFLFLLHKYSFVFRFSIDNTYFTTKLDFFYYFFLIFHHYQIEYTHTCVPKTLLHSFRISLKLSLILKKV